MDDLEIKSRFNKLEFNYPGNQTPWQELAREYTGQLGEGACLDRKKYINVASELNMFDDDEYDAQIMADDYIPKNESSDIKKLGKKPKKPKKKPSMPI